MATLPKNKKSPAADPTRLNNADFRWFIFHFPAVALKNARIKRSSFVAVGMALAQFGNYEHGTNVNPSVKLIHTLTGAHEDTIKKVYDLLKEHGALEVTGKHQGVNGGQPSEIFRFRRSHTVGEVLKARSAMAWKQRANPTAESANPIAAAANPTAEDNRNVRKERNCSVADAPSLSPTGSLPDGRAKASEEQEHEEKTTDELIASSWLQGDSLEELFGEMEVAP